MNYAVELVIGVLMILPSNTILVQVLEDVVKMVTAQEASIKRHQSSNAQAVKAMADSVATCRQGGCSQPVSLILTVSQKTSPCRLGQ